MGPVNLPGINHVGTYVAAPKPTAASGGLFPAINFGAIWDKYGKGNSAADILPGVNLSGGGATAPAPTAPTFAPGPKLATSSNGFTGDGSDAINGGSSAPAGPSHVVTDPLLAALSHMDETLANRNSKSQAEYNSAKAGYDAGDALDKQSFDQNKSTNEQTYEANHQKALLNAANGATGLRGVLASLGALSGSGLDVIHRLVSNAANSDAGEARQTFDANATNLSDAWGKTTQAEHQRRADAEATLANNFQDNKANVLTSKQSILQQLAQAFGPGTAEGDNYAAQATALAAPIADTTRASVAPYAKASSLFSPVELAKYLAGTQNLNVSTAPGADSGANTADPTALAINSPLNSSQKKDRLAGVA